MKIGFDASDLCTNHADGTTRYTWELAQRLPALAPQHEWHFFAPGPLPTHYNLLTTNSFWHSSPWPKYWTQTRLPFDLHKYQPDVLFMPIQQIPYLRPKNMKTVAVVHDLAWQTYGQQFTYKDWLLQHVFTSYVAKQADAIIAVSKSTADDIAHYYGRTKNVTVVHHGVNHNKFRQPTEQDKSASWQKLIAQYPNLRRPYILFVGQIQPRKNIERLIEAFEQLGRPGRVAGASIAERSVAASKANGPGDPEWQLVVAGSHGWLNKPIYERIKKSPLAKQIILTGRVPDDLLPALYWHADAFVLPSLYEGFGMPILEAMAAGCPVVTSNISSMPEIAGQAAVLVDPNNSQAIAAGIAQARTRRAELVTAGLAQAKKFDWARTVQQTLQVINNL